MSDTRHARSPYPTLVSYVRTTRAVLLAQVAAALVAGLATGYMLLELTPLVRERERLQKDIGSLNREMISLETARADAIAALRITQERVEQLLKESASAKEALESLQQELSKSQVALTSASRERIEVEKVLEQMRTTAIHQRQLAAKAQEASAQIVRRAVNAFHARDYARAIATYDSALAVDPLNVYIINLKSYSQFKAGNFTEAIETMKPGLVREPTYVHGYFDLARYQCAAGSPSEALQTIRNVLSEAVDKSDDPISPKPTKSALLSKLQYFLAEDGEFARLCRSIIGDLRALVPRSP